MLSDQVTLANQYPLTALLTKYGTQNASHDLTVRDQRSDYICTLTCKEISAFEDYEMSEQWAVVMDREHS